jgi:hypothetical protein
MRYAKRSRKKSNSILINRSAGHSAFFDLLKQTKRGGQGMPSKLKDLKVTKVDFVEAGANPEANILLFKSKDGSPNSKDAPSTEEGGEKSESAVKKFFSSIAKALGIGNEDVDQAVKEIAKGYEAATFGEKMDEQKRRRITSEIWDVCYALEESLCSIILDDDVADADKQGLMEQSLDEFGETMKELIPTWAQGKTTNKINKNEQPATPARLEIVKAAKEKLESIIAKANPTGQAPAATTPEGTTIQKQKPKGEKRDMKIDKSKLTPEELAALEAIEKKAGIQDEPANEPKPADVNKGAGDQAAPTAAGGESAAAEEGEDIYKGLHPAVKAELESLRKTADALEDRELTEIAKKYEIIGKKPEELVPMFKNLKAAGGDAYDQMITILDASVTAVEKSGIFSEIGKKGNGETDAWAAIEKHADEIQKSMPNLTRAQAVNKACEQHPELVHEYENKR